MISRLQNGVTPLSWRVSEAVLRARARSGRMRTLTGIRPGAGRPDLITAAQKPP